MKNKVKKISAFLKFHTHVAIEMLQVYKWKTVLLLILSLLLPIEEIIAIKYSEYLTNSVIYIQEDYEFLNIIRTLIIFITIIFIFKIINWIFDITYNWYAKNVSMDINEKLLKKLSKIEYEYFEDANIHNKIFMAKSAPERYSTSMFVMTALVNYFVKLFAYVFMLAQIELIFIPLIFILLIFNTIISYKAISKWGNYYSENVIPHQRMCNYFESIMNNRISQSNIQINRQLPFFVKKYEECADLERKHTLKSNLFNFVAEFVAAILFGIIFGIIIIYTIVAIIGGKYQLGVLTAVCAIMFSVFGIMKGLISFTFQEKEYMQIVMAYEEIMELNEVNHEKSYKEDNGYLMLNDVSYKYKQSKYNIINDISIEFKSNEKIAIVGENGSGKTTFIYLLLDMLKNQKGTIINSIGDAIGILQEFPEYSLSIKENIELGRGGEIMEKVEIINILQKVQLWEYVKSLPDGINTYIGQLEDGTEFSKGQFQRLAVARLLANKNANIWILDEPTAYLDPIAEIDMYEYILNLGKEKLIFFISHRLGFAKFADKILVIDKGKIIESGKHEVLMQREGKYYNMYQLQKNWYIS